MAISVHPIVRSIQDDPQEARKLRDFMLTAELGATKKFKFCDSNGAMQEILLKKSGARPYFRRAEKAGGPGIR